MKENSIENFKKELEEKEKIFEEKYINDMKHNDYLSEEACKMRKEIFRLNREIREKEREENSMNEEEKKAIEILKEIEINTYAEGKAIAIDTVLKLIKKLQKENELLRQQNISYKNNINELKKVRNK